MSHTNKIIVPIDFIYEIEVLNEENKKGLYCAIGIKYSNKLMSDPIFDIEEGDYKIENTEKLREIFKGIVT